MKISELQQMATALADAKIPVSMGGQNLSLTVGQIADLISSQVVRFASVRNNPSANIGIGIAGSTALPIIYDEGRGDFYAEYVFDGQTTYYTEWDGKEKFYHNGNIATNAIFAADNGNLYFYKDGLVRAGLPSSIAEQITHNTPIKKTETELQAMRDNHTIVPGQIYYTVEE